MCGSAACASQRSRTRKDNLRERYGTLTHCAFDGVP